ncbi:MAG: hypothetical protein AB1772_01110 [Candidatus Zixiibacteriota bacterium]
MNRRRIGVDFHADFVRVATTHSEFGRTVVEKLEQLAPPIPEEWARDTGGRFALSVPDSQTMVKALRIDPSGSIPLADRLRFELAQSVLESESLFHMDTIGTVLPDRHLGMIFRREHVKELTHKVGLAPILESEGVSVQSRAIALGRGYLTFCMCQDGGLVVLADVSAKAASICLLYDRQIADVTSLPMLDYNMADDSGRARFGADLKTILNYRQSLLREAGISVPPSAIFVAGEMSEETVLKTLQPHFAVDVSAPRLIEGYFAGLGQADHSVLSAYLVALGLTVN